MDHFLHCDNSIALCAEDIEVIPRLESHEQKVGVMLMLPPSREARSVMFVALTAFESLQKKQPVPVQIMVRRGAKRGTCTMHLNQVL